MSEGGEKRGEEGRSGGAGGDKRRHDDDDDDDDMTLPLPLLPPVVVRETNNQLE